MDERGQATIDYTTLLAVVAVLLVAGIALVPGAGRGVANALRAQTERALCIVAGRSCPLDRPRPCAVAMRRETRHHAVNIGFVRLDKDRWVVRELMSDGTLRLTVVKRFGGGTELGLGAKAQIDQDLTSGAIRREVKLGFQGIHGTGNVYVARDAREAEKIMQALAEGDDPAAPVVESFLEGGLRLDASLATGGPVAGLEFERNSLRILSVRSNHKTGAKTISFSLGDGGSALAAAVVGGPTASFNGLTTFSLTLDRHLRPIELSLLAIGNVAGGAQLSQALAAPLALNGNQNAPANLVGRRWEFAARLDLSDPDVAAAWKRFRRSPLSVTAIRGLARALRERAHLDLRTYKSKSTSNGTALGVAIGFKLGGETEHTIDRFNLLAASSRPPGGLWEPRLDCV